MLFKDSRFIRIASTADGLVCLAEYDQIIDHTEATMIIEQLKAFYATHTDEEINLNNNAGRRDNLAGYVYIIRFSNGVYKIGASAHPDQRMKRLKSTFGELEVIHIVESGNYLEAEVELQELYKDKRLGRRDRFSFSTDDIDEIKTIRSM